MQFVASALCRKLQDIRLQFQSTINNIPLLVQVSLRLRWRWWYIIWSISRQPHANRGWRADRMKEMRLRIPNPLIYPQCGLESQSERISLPSLLPFFQQIFDSPVNHHRPVSVSLCQNEILSTPKKSGPTLQHPRPLSVMRMHSTCCYPNLCKDGEPHKLHWCPLFGILYTIIIFAC